MDIAGGDGAGGIRTPAPSGSLIDSRVPVNQTDGSREGGNDDTGVCPTAYRAARPPRPEPQGDITKA